MKKSLVLLATAAIAAASFTGCKKGAEDPGISLRSRDARLVNEWKLTKVEGTTTSEDNSLQDISISGFVSKIDRKITTSSKVTFDGTNFTEENKYTLNELASNSAGSATTTRTVSGTTKSPTTMELTIAKDGTYTILFKSTGNAVDNYTQSSTPANTCGTGQIVMIANYENGIPSQLTCDGTYAPTSSGTNTSNGDGTGNWVWLNSKKDKSVISFISGPWAGTSMTVLRLANSELVLEDNTTDNNDYNYVSSDNTIKTNGSSKETNNMKWTFESK